jgi:hypothetical protein
MILTGDATVLPLPGEQIVTAHQNRCGIDARMMA